MILTSKQKTIGVIALAAVAVLALTFGYMSYKSKSKWQLRALIAEPQAAQAVSEFEKLDKQTQKTIKEKDKVINDAQIERRKLIDERDRIEVAKNVVATKYQTLLNSITAMKPSEVVEKINVYIRPEIATLIASNDVMLRQTGAQFTLKLFTEGKRDNELLIEEKKTTTNLTNQNNTLLTEKAALKGEVEPLKVDLSACKNALTKVIDEKDAWEKTAKKSLKWEKIERVTMVLAIIATALKFAKVF